MNTIFLQLVNNIVQFNCSVLKVSIPSIKIVESSEFATSTVKSAVSADGRLLLINRNFIESKPDKPLVWLVISHECRHIWQANYADLFNDYQTSDNQSIIKYNEQPAEVDAWAWSVLVTSRKFGIRPTLEKNFGAVVWSQIQERVKQIIDKKIY